MVLITILEPTHCLCVLNFSLHYMLFPSEFFTVSRWVYIFYQFHPMLWDISRSNQNINPTFSFRVNRFTTTVKNKQDYNPNFFSKDTVGCFQVLTTSIQWYLTVWNIQTKMQTIAKAPLSAVRTSYNHHCDYSAAIKCGLSQLQNGVLPCWIQHFNPSHCTDSLAHYPSSHQL